MKTEYAIGGFGTVLSATGTVLQTNDILQTISLIITIIGALISFIVIPLLNWRKNAKKDGKIDDDELKEGAEILKDGIDKTKETIEKGKKDHE